MRDALDLYDLPFFNYSGEAIPPYAVMQVDNWKDDENNRDYFRVKKPDGDGKMFIVNGPLEIAVGGDGMGSRHDGIPASYLTGTPAVNEEWGPTSGSWYLSDNGIGISIVGGAGTINGVQAVRVSFASGGLPEITTNKFDASELLGYETTEDGEVYNATGRPIWDGNRSALFSRMILASESPESFVCKIAEGATIPPETMEDLEILGDDVFRFPTGQFTSSAEFLAIQLADPFGFLADAAVGDYLYVRIMRASEGGFGGPGWAGVVLRAQTEAENAQSGGGGGGSPWTGWPGPDPTTGVAPGIVFLAHVDETAAVTSADGTFDFDDTTSMIGTAPASGEANNSALRAFLPGELILVFGDSTPTYHAFKVSENIALATVNEATGVKLTDSTFSLDGFTPIIGTVEATGDATNVPAGQYSNNQVLKVILNDDAKWQPLETYKTALFLTTSTITARSGTYTWGTGTGTLLAKTGVDTHSVTGATTGVNIYNSSLDSIATDRIVQCKMIDGQWFIDVDDCS